MTLFIFCCAKIQNYGLTSKPSNLAAVVRRSSKHMIGRRPVFSCGQCVWPWAPLQNFCPPWQLTDR